MKRKKFFHGSIIRFFDIVGEITGGQLVLTSMVSHTLATDPLARAGFVGTIAAFLVDLDLTFHRRHNLRWQKNA